ncbi:MAG: 2-oxo-4-hydroxy-4-carboxy-5-ureidoimidazoline decarboxylase, partial [Ancalomicrobiaceae bacterium]|nr:2-oxo-4-hydroxy-4-carboxy-5-ureidoimidazoline decarboxylase [Ancalomicrobiaceae bacterium]
NDAYNQRFGIPFIFAVKGATKDMILTAFETRIGNDIGTEVATALAQVGRIFRFRIEARVLP